MFEKLLTDFSAWNRRRRAARKARKAVLRHPHRFGVLAIMKNEAINIDEWIEHYLWMGAGKIYLIDNGSTDDTVAKARAWQGKAPVELVEYPQKHKQVQHYRTAFRRFRIARECQWLLIADLDEFWFCPNGDTIARALTEYEGTDVIYGHWAMFGSSGLVNHPASVRRSFTVRRPGTAGLGVRKYVARTSVLRRANAIHIHGVVGACSSRTSTEIERFQLNHYPIQSVEFFQRVKMDRGDVSHRNFETFRDMAYFHRYDEGCDVPDRTLADLVEAAMNR